MDKQRVKFKAVVAKAAEDKKKQGVETKSKQKWMTEDILELMGKRMIVRNIKTLHEEKEESRKRVLELN